MTCPYCGAPDVPETADSCPMCRKALRGRETIPSERTVAVATPNRKPYILSGILAALVLALVIALILMMNRSKEPVTAAPEVLPPVPGPAVTEAPTPAAPPPAPPVTQAPTPEPPKPAPPDPNKLAVEAYLQKVAYIERRRQEVVNNLSPALLAYALLKAGMGSLNSGALEELMASTPEEEQQAREKAKNQGPDQTEKVITGYVQSLRVLDAQFRQIQPPPPARNFAAAYDNALIAYASVFVEIQQAIQQQKIDITAGPLTQRKEQALQAADAQLSALTQQYGIRKPFDVTDTPSGGVAGTGM